MKRLIDQICYNIIPNDVCPCLIPNELLGIFFDQKCSCVAVLHLHLLDSEALAVEQAEQKISEPIPLDFLWLLIQVRKRDQATRNLLLPGNGRSRFWKEAKNLGNKALLAQFLGLRHRMGRVYWPSGVSAQHSSVHGAVLVQLEKTVSPTIAIKITKYFIVA